MKRSVEQLEHTEEFKRAVEDCKKTAKPGTNCFAVITDAFKRKGKPIFVKQKDLDSELIEQGLQPLNVKIFTEFEG